MKRIIIDETLCQGSADCVSWAPQAIELDGTGVAHVVAGHDELDDELADKIAARCPSMAITAIPHDEHAGAARREENL